MGIFLEIRNDDVIAVRPHRIRNRLGDFREKGWVKSGKQQSDGERYAGSPAARDPVGLIIDFFASPQDALPGSGADLALVAQDFGHRDH